MEFSIMDRQILPNLYNPRERQAIYQVMCATRQMGGHHMAEKEAEIRQVMNHIGITPTDQAISRTLTQQQMTATLRNMDDGPKLYFAKFISCIALVGGNNQKETMFVQWMNSEVGVPDI